MPSSLWRKEGDNTLALEQRPLWQWCPTFNLLDIDAFSCDGISPLWAELVLREFFLKEAQGGQEVVRRQSVV